MMKTDYMSVWAIAGNTRHLENFWTDFARKFASLTIVDTTHSQTVLRYYQNRLGITGYAEEKFPALTDPQKIEVKILGKPASSEAVADLTLGLEGRSLLVAPSEAKLTEYFELFSKEPKRDREILAAKYSGSFGLLREKIKNAQNDLILLLTTNIFLHFFSNLPMLDNLIILRLPFEAPGKRPELTGGQTNFFDHVFHRTKIFLRFVLH